MISGSTLALAQNTFSFAAYWCSKAAFTDMSYGSQKCCDWKDLFLAGEDITEKWNLKCYPVSEVIHSWQERTESYRTLILIVYSWLIKLTNLDQHHKWKHKWPRRNNCVPLSFPLPRWCQSSALGMMRAPLLVGKGKVMNGNYITKSGKSKSPVHKELEGNSVLQRDTCGINK